MPATKMEYRPFFPREISVKGKSTRTTSPRRVHDYHYDLRLQIQDRLCYVESLLLDRDPTDPSILIVSIHDV